MTAHGGKVTATHVRSAPTSVWGAALSSTLGGLLAARFGWEAAFLGLTSPAVLALGLATRLFGQASSANAAAISARV